MCYAASVQYSETVMFGGTPLSILIGTPVLLKGKAEPQNVSLADG